MSMIDAAFLKPGFPKISYSDNGTTTQLEFVVDEEPTDLIDLLGENATPYEGIVTAATYEEMETSGFYSVSITCELLYEAPDTGTLKEVSYEIEWVLVERSLFEHPVFVPGGAYELDGGDFVDIGNWKIEKDDELKKAYKYWRLDEDGNRIYEVELSPHAQILVKGLELGIETWPDYVPVLRKISRYVNGPPPSTDAGLKETVGSFPGKPSGWEWRKSADRATRAGGERKWDKTEEWEGAATVWVDAQNIYWYAPPE